MYSVKSISGVLLVSVGALWISAAADDLLGGTLTEIEIVASDPPSGAIDARIPHPADDPAVRLGWSVINVTFNGDVSGLAASDFTVTEEGGDGLPPTVAELLVLRDDTVTLTLSEPIEPGAWTVLTHEASGTSVRVGYLPGDADGDGLAGPVDLLTLIDGLNGQHQPPLEAWQADVDRNGIQEEADVQALTDLLQGNGAFESWGGRTLPGRVPGSCGSSPAILGAVIELIPATPGPYAPGSTITVEMYVRQIPPGNDIYLRMVQFDMNASDPALTLNLFDFTYDTQAACALDPGLCGTMHAEFPGLYDSDGAVVSTVFLGMSQNTLMQMLLAGDGSLGRFGTLTLTLPTTGGTYLLDALNAGTADPNDYGAQLRFGFGGSDPISECTAGNGCLTGGLLDLAVSAVADCNGNGIPDDEDISGGTSQDCNGNGVPDECDMPVCGNDCIEGGIGYPAEECDGTDDQDCPGRCYPAGHALECTCGECGDGVVGPGEDCESGVCCTGTCTFDVGTVCRASTGPCDPAESCDGTGADCPSNVIITACIHGDGCCPGGCNAVNDNDCPAICGNGVVEPGEECDGTADQACPGECQANCTCSSGQIPTVSEWGLIVTTLMLLTAGKVCFRRRPTGV